MFTCLSGWGGPFAPPMSTTKYSASRQKHVPLARKHTCSTWNNMRARVNNNALTGPFGMKIKLN